MKKLANETTDAWIERTDHALYAAKNAGRNQAKLYESQLINSLQTIKK